MFLGIVASAGLFLGPLTTALLGSMLPFPGMIPWMQSAPASPSVAWEQVFPLLSSGGKELFSETLEAVAVYTLIEDMC